MPVYRVWSEQEPEADKTLSAVNEEHAAVLFGRQRWASSIAKGELPHEAFLVVLVGRPLHDTAPASFRIGCAVDVNILWR